jgi:hypothetical protein
VTREIFECIQRLAKSSSQDPFSSFYVYQPPRSLEVILGEIEALEGEIQGMSGNIFD